MRSHHKKQMKYDLVEIPPERELRVLRSSLDLVEKSLSPFLVTSTPSLADIVMYEEIKQLEMLPSTSEFSPKSEAFKSSRPKTVAWLGLMESELSVGYKQTHKMLIGAIMNLEKRRNKAKAKL